MTASQTEHLSIILETVAFFFVTVDLYGKERLVALQNRIKKVEIDKVKKGKVFLKTSHLVCGAILLIMMKFIEQKVLPFLRPVANHFTPNSTLQLIIYIMLFVLAIYAAALFIINLDDIYSFFSNVVFASFIKGLISFSSLFRIEGVMVTIGAILFLTSKILAYIDVH